MDIEGYRAHAEANHAIAKKLGAWVDVLLKENAELKARLAEAEAKERSHALIAEQLENAIDCMATAEAENARLKDLAEKFILLVDRCDLRGPAIQCREASNELARAIGFTMKERVARYDARQAALRPERLEPQERRPAHTHYCQEHADRWECKDGNCERGEVSGCPERPADATPTPAMLDAREACREVEGK